MSPETRKMVGAENPMLYPLLVDVGDGGLPLFRERDRTPPEGGALAVGSCWPFRPFPEFDKGMDGEAVLEAGRRYVMGQMS